MDQTQTANQTSGQSQAGTIAGYFENHTEAERAVDALRDAGFTSAHVGVAHRGGSYGSETSSGSTAGAVGEKAEGAWEKFKNFFTGGPEAYAEENTRGDLGTREVTSYDNDGDRDDFHQNLQGLSVPEDRSRYLSHRFQNNDNGVVVTVNAGPRSGEAEEILTRYGADLGHNAASYDYTSQPTATGQTGRVEDSQNIQLLGEMLRVHKERINRGEVRLRKEVITETQTVQVPVTREELVIERHAVEGNTPAQGTIGQNEEIRIPLSEETASLDKSTFVREEVAVGKRPVENVRDLSGEVRREELVVDDQTERKAVNR
ncbi:MAG TPA: YsnF/AvaK domain-containing protein [Acidobacteriaceae bacterium]|jgi:uncharacterized protein (TIGR02271 family)|nr:YsnF/AvaK domain-containing protein [Acidobacteriaceae bacterium]